MDVRRLADLSAFLEAAGPLLLEDEPRHNLMLGIAGTLANHPGVYREHRLWLVEHDGRVAGAALQTPPFNLVVARPTFGGAMAALAGAIHAQGVELPGATAAVPEVNSFAQAWMRCTGVRARRRMAQRIYRVTTVQSPAGVLGRARAAAESDRALLVSWVQAFADEVLSEVESPAQRAEQTVDARLRQGTGGFMLWENGGETVSLAGWGGETPNGVRIGPVYTPPEDRRRGYGSAVTAAVSAERLAASRRFCFLYTDLANPTSNKIYTDIGYEPICDSVDYAFDRS